MEKYGDKRKVSELDIHKKLLELGISTNLKGYHYLRTAIRVIVNELDGKYPDKIVPFYSDIAKIHDTSGMRVERAIRYAIETGYNNVGASVYYEVFGNSTSSDRSKPTNSQFISTVVETINLE